MRKIGCSPCSSCTHARLSAPLGRGRRMAESEWHALARQSQDRDVSNSRKCTQFKSLQALKKVISQSWVTPSLLPASSPTFKSSFIMSSQLKLSDCDMTWGKQLHLSWKYHPPLPNSPFLSHPPLPPPSLPDPPPPPRQWMLSPRFSPEGDEIAWMQPPIFGGNDRIFLHHPLEGQLYIWAIF